MVRWWLSCSLLVLLAGIAGCDRTSDLIAQASAQAPVAGQRVPVAVPAIGMPPMVFPPTVIPPAGAENTDLRTPFLKSLDEMARASEGFSDSERNEVRTTIARGDRIFQAAKVQGREAVRQANRQPRVSGAQSPTVVLIQVPGLSASDLGIYRTNDAGTPNLDRLALEGVRFTKLEPLSPLPVVARCCLLQGLNAKHCRISSDDARLALLPEDLTLPEVFWKAGYATQGVGRWDLGDPGTTGAPYLQGFDSWYGSLERRLATQARPAELYRNEVRVPLNDAPIGPQPANRLFTEEAVKIIQAQTRASRPLFLLVSYADLSATGDAVDRAAKVSLLDAEIGKILTALDAKGMSAGSLVMVTSDVPANAGDTLPLVVRWPDRIGRGQVDEHPATHADLLPTLATAIGAWRTPPVLDGKPLVAALTPPLAPPSSAERRAKQIITP